MQEKEFVALVDRLELYERRNPVAYRFRVALLAALGYLFLFGVLVLALLFLAGVIYARKLNFLVIQLLVILISVAVVVLRSLKIEFPEPQGQELKRYQAPRLFDLVEEVRAATNGPRLYKVLLTEEFNASIVQRPRLGMFGGHQNYLRIGLPLLRALSLADVRAVLAHEFGHLSGSHGKFSCWIYRVRQTWTQLLQNLKQQPRYGPGVFERFFNWYAPYFHAYTFVLARAQEYEADRCSVAVAGKENAARALINMELKGRALNEDFWPAFYRRADTQAEAPSESFTEMLQSLREPVAPDKAQAWFSESLTMRHSYNDTHPALAARLTAMGVTEISKTADLNLFVVADNEPRGDEYLLARPPANFIEAQNNRWKEQLASRWSDRHKFVAEAEQALATFAEKAQSTELTVEERWQRAYYLTGLKGSIAAIPFLRDVLALMPDHAAANYTLGEALLQQGDDAGIKHIEVAMEKDINALPGGCQTIFTYLTVRNRTEEAEKYQQCINGYYSEVELARREREHITTSDEFETHGLPAEALEALRTELAKFPLLKSAYLVKKVCKHLPNEPSFVLGVISKRSLGLQLDGRDKKLIQQLASDVSYPGYTFIIPLEHNYKLLRMIFKRIKGSEIYRAS